MSNDKKDCALRNKKCSDRCAWFYGTDCVIKEFLAMKINRLKYLKLLEKDAMNPENYEGNKGKELTRKMTLIKKIVYF